MTITWEQIKVALDTLINVCLNNPVKAATGGSAYYGHNQVVPGVMGRHKMRNTLNGKLTVQPLFLSLEQPQP